MTTYMGVGHPGACPRCGEHGIQWTWKPDLEPTTEKFYCCHCQWTLIRNFKGYLMIELELSDREANVVKQALSYWVSNARKKCEVMRARIEKQEKTGAPLLESMKADKEYMDTTLPVRLDAAEGIIKRIGEGARTAAGL